MERLFSDPDVAAVFMVFAIPIVAIVCNSWYHIARFRADHELKRTMIERGMSAQDIAQVMAADTGKHH